jgi:hypothetical protein
MVQILTTGTARSLLHGMKAEEFSRQAAAVDNTLLVFLAPYRNSVRKVTSWAYTIESQ